MPQTEREHPPEAALLTLLHNQPLGTRAELQSHLRFCESCRARMLSLSCREQEIEALLAALDHPMPAHDFGEMGALQRGHGPRRGTLIGGVATVIAVVAAAATLPGFPLSKWVRARPAPARVADMPQAVTAPSATISSGVSIAAPAALVVTLLRTQSQGAVVVTFGGTDSATVRSRGGAVSYEIGDGHITIDNRAPAEAYEIQVPAALARLVVLMGDRVLFRKEGTTISPTPGLDGGRRYRVSLDSSGGAIGNKR